MTASPLLNYRYRVLKSLAEGGFGKTFLAEDTQMPSRRRCVIKQLKPASSRPEIAQLIQERFTREAAVLDTLGRKHHQIPELYAYFVLRGQFYLVQEWIDGQPLGALGQSPWTEERVRQLLHQLLPALAHIHQQNVIHRDIKPDNIILRQADQLPCLIDFGAVKELMGTVISPSGSAQSSIVIGTPGFMPMEQATGRPVFSSDLYSLTMTAICLLTGRSPADIPTDSTTGQYLWQQYAPNTSLSFTTLLNRAIHPYAQNRYPTANDMLAAFANPAAQPKAAQPISQPALAISPTLAPPSSIPQTIRSTTISKGHEEALAQGIPQRTLQRFARSPWPVKTVVFSTIFLLLGTAVVTSFGQYIGDVSFSGKVAVNSDSNEASRDVTVNSEVTVNSSRTSGNENLATEPSSAEAYVSRAASFYSQGQEAKALQDIDAALELEPDLVSAIALKGDILANQTKRDLAGAIELYSQAISLAPNDATLLGKRCKAHIDTQDWDLAHQDCTQALTLEPENAVFFDQRGDIRTAQQNYQGAVDDYTQAIDLNTAAGQEQLNQPIYFSRAQAYGELGDPEKALADFDRVRTPPTGLNE